MMTFFFMAAFVLQRVYGAVLGAVDETDGTIGTVELEPTLPVMGGALGVGTSCTALTPRLPIS
jgi:hypothetical protein